MRVCAREEGSQAERRGQVRGSERVVRGLTKRPKGERSHHSRVGGCMSRRGVPLTTRNLVLRQETRWERMKGPVSAASGRRRDVSCLRGDDQAPSSLTSGRRPFRRGRGVLSCLPAPCLFSLASWCVSQQEGAQGRSAGNRSCCASEGCHHSSVAPLILMLLITLQPPLPTARHHSVSLHPRYPSAEMTLPASDDDPETRSAAAHAFILTRAYFPRAPDLFSFSYSRQNSDTLSAGSPKPSCFCERPLSFLLSSYATLIIATSTVTTADLDPSLQHIRAPMRCYVVPFEQVAASLIIRIGTGIVKFLQPAQNMQLHNLTQQQTPPRSALATLHAIPGPFTLTKLTQMSDFCISTVQETTSALLPCFLATPAPCLFFLRMNKKRQHLPGPIIEILKQYKFLEVAEHSRM